MSPGRDMETGAHPLFREAPVVGVVRTGDRSEGARHARALITAGLRLIEITFTVPGAAGLVRELLAERRPGEAYAIGMGTVTTPARGREAVDAGAEFIVSPNTHEGVAEVARGAGRFLVMGGLTSTEIVRAHELGADLVKVYPLPPVGGPVYLATIRGPLGDIPMLASGGFGIDEITAYRRAGASAFGIGAPLLGVDRGAECRQRVALAIARARGEEAV